MPNTVLPHPSTPPTTIAMNSSTCAFPTTISMHSTACATHAMRTLCLPLACYAHWLHQRRLVHVLSLPRWMPLLHVLQLQLRLPLVFRFCLLHVLQQPLSLHLLRTLCLPLTCYHNHQLQHRRLVHVFWLPTRLLHVFWLHQRLHLLHVLQLQLRFPLCVFRFHLLHVL